MIALSAAGASLVLDARGPGLPEVLHWGADPGSSQGTAALLALRPPGPPRPLIPSQGEGWFGRPALSGHRDGTWRPTRFELTEPLAAQPPAAGAGADAGPGAGGKIVVRAADPQAGLALDSELELTAQGVLRVRHTLTNTAQTPYTLDRLAALMPVPAQAVEILDFAGRWSRERSPQRAALRQGAWVRENRRGRTGFDAGPLIAGSAGFAFRSGQVWAVHTAWSGNHVQYVERLADGRAVLGGGELLEPGEIRLRTGQSYQSPWVYFASGESGLDELSARLHRMLRGRSHHPATPRPVTLNIWEAVYFDHTLDRLLDLADKAAAIGVERFVVDDGWFRHRRTDDAGLGDWYVDETVWPGGLHPLVERVRKHGMQFGLWFEPEMVNPDSDLARAHPDWFLADPARLPAEQRNQQVLDVARPEAFGYLLERLDSLVGEYRIDYIKWDHNRDIAEPLHDGTPGVHAQTLAVYRLLDELRARNPGLEIESCSSGGARVDLGVLERTDRVWGSDNIDPIERQSIQRWTSLLIPYELIGAHVGSSPAHVSARATDLSFRAATALFGHAGIESDITGWDERDLEQLAQWIAEYKRLRPLLHSGEVVRADHPDPAAWLHGVVAPGREHALFAYVQLETSAFEHGAALRFPGLDEDADYELTVLPVVSAAPQTWPQWAAGGQPAVLPGRVLTTIGVEAPRLVDKPGQSFVIELLRQG
ncbi:alpha-galactosidase [Actinocrinis puniceicyclus]|uniref:alpha-galactosidase n=1 Tax=Actinocrinis puniceicyclus TaxID=977794 RepID=UPI001FE414C8